MKQPTEQEIINEWANGNINAACDDIEEEGREVTPELLSEYLTDLCGLPFSVQEASDWLSDQDWYK